MRKQTKLVAVLSAAALLAMGASMTSFAAGWQKDDAGVWHYYDSDDDMVTGEWKKDGGKWFYLDEDGDMAVDQWIDDEYYVGDDGAMLTNAWKYTMSDDDQDDPDEDGENWYYFNNKGKKVADETKKINGKTYLFDSDGKMQYGWQYEGGNMYYYGDEMDGARTESQWLWLSKSGSLDSDETDDQDIFPGCNDNNGEMCDDEGWYWFQSSGKMYTGTAKKKINGKFYMFNEHGQMLYEWINNTNTVKYGSNAELDGSHKKQATASNMFYYNAVEEGWRGDGWYEMDGSEDMGTDSDTDWYLIDDGEITYAKASDFAGVTDNDNKKIYVMRKKVKVSGNKYFAFNEKGQMQDGLQFIKNDGGFFYFDENGYMKTGKVASVECDDDDYTFFFTTKNGKNGIGYTGEKDGYLYYNGKRLEADDDYRFFYVEGKVYLVNSKGKVQKATGTKGRDFDDIENKSFVNVDDVTVMTNKNGVVSSIDGKAVKVYTDAVEAAVAKSNNFDAEKQNLDVTVPFISMYDNVYTYESTTDAAGKVTVTSTWR